MHHYGSSCSVLVSTVVAAVSYAQQAPGHNRMSCHYVLYKCVPASLPVLVHEHTFVVASSQQCSALSALSLGFQVSGLDS